MIRKTAVLGAGTMGHGIAAAFAAAGYQVSLYDTNERALRGAESKIRKAMKELETNKLLSGNRSEELCRSVHISTSLKDAVCDADYIIEAAPEILSVKQELMGELDRYCRQDAVLASNTSGLRLTDIVEKLPESRRQRTMICHWFNPAHIVPAVELSYYGKLLPEVFREVKDFYISLGKKPVTVLKEKHGLVANRLQHGIVREAFALIEEGVASPEDIENAAKYGPCFRLATTGLLELCDLGGIDIWAETAKNLWPSLDNTATSSKLLDKMVLEGRLGAKTGRGFYEYGEGVKDKKEEMFRKKLIEQLKLQQKVETEEGK